MGVPRRPGLPARKPSDRVLEIQENGASCRGGRRARAVLYAVAWEYLGPTVPRSQRDRKLGLFALVDDQIEADVRRGACSKPVSIKVCSHPEGERQIGPGGPEKLAPLRNDLRNCTVSCVKT